MTAPSTLVGTVQAANVAVAGQIFGDVYQGAVRRPGDFILDFDLDTPTRGFVGRADVFEQLTLFTEQNPAGYVEISGEAGLGKTALAAQIARRFDAVAFLARASSGVQRPEQFLTHMSASLITRYQLDHRTLPVRAGEDATYLIRVLRESVRAAGKPVWLVVDGLDEAVPPPPGSNPLLLPPYLPDGVYTVVTRRTGELITDPGTPRLPYRLRREDPRQVADIQAFITARVQGDPKLAAALDGGRSPNAREQSVMRLTAASEGNFMYVAYMLADVAAGRTGTGGSPLDPADLPIGLRGYYEQFWARMYEASGQNWRDWDGLFQPVLERLAVAREPVTADWLAGQVSRPTNEVRGRVLEPWARVLGHTGTGAQQAWSLVHRSFADFLEDRLDLTSAHRAVAGHYYERWDEFDTWDDYGLRHTAAHLSETARRMPETDRHPDIAKLVRLVAEHRFQRANLRRLHDPLSLRRDLEEAHRLSAKDPHPDATFLLVVVVLTLLRFRRKMLQPAGVFDAARRGDLETAERLLDLFDADLDPDWRQAIELTLAWLAAPTAHQIATRLTERIAAQGLNSANLRRLVDHVRAGLHGTPHPVGDLPAPVDPLQAEAMLVRLAGAGDSSLLGAYGLGPAELLGAGGYLATVDGPPLVALALADPAEGEPRLRRYLDIHIAYGYRQYRNQSLWELLSAVLRHPNPEWTRHWLEQVSLAVLTAPSRGEFLEGLDIAVLTLQAIAGDTAARTELDTHRDKALQDAAALPPSPMRGQGDVWATHKRRLAALAEAYTRLPGTHATAAELVSAALNIAPGYAGFAAPASLTLAETVSVAAPDHQDWIELALTAAEASAHNIQDTTFCARTTARVTAMRQRWWPTPTAPTEAIDALVTDVSATRFGSAHVVGERYAYRDMSSVRLPAPMTAGHTLRELAETYQRPLPDFQRHNENHRPDDHLPAGTHVTVPDPGFPPLLAARLSAAVLAASPPGAELSALVRHLVPIAETDVTALCTVLTRLLLCSPTSDTQLLVQLRRLIKDTAAAASDQHRTSDT